MKKGQITERRSWVLATIRDIKCVDEKGGLYPDMVEMTYTIKRALDQALKDGRDLVYLTKGTLKELSKTKLDFVTKQRVCAAFAGCACVLLYQNKITEKEYHDIVAASNLAQKRFSFRELAREYNGFSREGLDGLLGVGVKSEKEIEKEINRRESLERAKRGW